MKFIRASLFFTFSAVLAACAPIADNGNDGQASSASSSESSSVRSVRETQNVSYTGTVRPAGISIYMEGTHRLELDSEKFILLESDSLDLNGYVNEKVEVYGAVRPTVESDAIIMDVEEIELLESSSATSASSVKTSGESSESQASVASSEGSSESVEETSENSESSTASSRKTSANGVDHSSEFEARIEAMANEDVSAGRWTQEYCTGHIGFCIPVHKNWWFQSFGATDTEFWHVEMNTEPLERIHDGPISVRLVSGSLASLGVADGEVQQEGNNVVGYRSWAGDRHFEIVADARLDESVRFITANLEEYEEQE